jgi:hypothetical protein
MNKYFNILKKKINKKINKLIFEKINSFLKKNKK